MCPHLDILPHHPPEVWEGGELETQFLKAASPIYNPLLWPTNQPAAALPKKING